MKTSISVVWKIKVDKEKCIGCEACTAVCDNFKMAGVKAIAVKEEVRILGCSQQAADVCPVDAITVRKLEK